MSSNMCDCATRRILLTKAWGPRHGFIFSCFRFFYAAYGCCCPIGLPSPWPLPLRPTPRRDLKMNTPPLAFSPLLRLLPQTILGISGMPPGSVLRRTRRVEQVTRLREADPPPQVVESQSCGDRSPRDAEGRPLRRAHRLLASQTPDVTGSKSLGVAPGKSGGLRALSVGMGWGCWHLTKVWCLLRQPILEKRFTFLFEFFSIRFSSHLPHTAATVAVLTPR